MVRVIDTVPPEPLGAERYDQLLHGAHLRPFGVLILFEMIIDWLTRKTSFLSIVYYNQFDRHLQQLIFDSYHIPFHLNSSSIITITQQQHIHHHNFIHSTHYLCCLLQSLLLCVLSLVGELF